ncbi:MAG: hypothetical protein PHQ12_13995 [Chthoniobacteraceae bacterium]|nr:hypothetical protein [Chthoniobacteraceae bacterium]
MGRVFAETWTAEDRRELVAAQERAASAQPGDDEWKRRFDPPFIAPAEIPRDSALRKTLFEPLRVKIAKKAKAPVRFEGSLRAYRNWAFFQGGSVDAKGKAVVDNDWFGSSDTVGLWLRTREGWQLVAWSWGHTDAFYIHYWPNAYGAPRELLGAENETAIEPDSPEWPEVFDPPYRKVTEISVGSELRKKLFAVMRPAMERYVKRPVQFRGSLAGYKNWACFEGGLVDAKGQFLEEKRLDLIYNQMAILLLRGQEGWIVVDYESGVDDDPFGFFAWPQKYGEAVWGYKTGAPRPLSGGLPSSGEPGKRN